jgi:hypothetical protein
VFRTTATPAARGMTILEMVVSLGIATVVIVCMTTFFALGLRAWAVAGTQGTVDRDASYAVRRIIRDVREAARVEVGGADHAFVYFPLRQPDGTYAKGTIDDTAIVEYYRGNADGDPQTGGACLWRAVSGEPESAIARHVTQLQFQSDAPDSLRVTVALAETNTFGTFSCTHMSRVIKLRNW